VNIKWWFFLMVNIQFCFSVFFILKNIKLIFLYKDIKNKNKNKNKIILIYIFLNHKSKWAIISLSDANVDF